LVLVIAVSLTFSWFQDYSTNNGTINKIEVSSGEMLLISVNGGDFSNKFNFDYEDLLLDDVTGDGISFIIPEKTISAGVSEHGLSYTNIFSAIPSDNGNYVVAKSTFDIETAKKAGTADPGKASYISLNLTFQANSSMSVYLGSESYVNPNSKYIVLEDGDEENEIGNKSDYGDFSKDGIAGAARVAFTDGTNVPMYWIPNSTYELSFGPVTKIIEGVSKTVNDWSFTPNGTAEDEITGDQSGYYYYKELEGVATKVDLTSSQYVKTLPTITKDTTEAPIGATPLLTLEYDDAKGVYQGEITVNIWIEGCDRESRRALAGGCLDINLKFVGMAVAEPAQEP